MAISLVAAEISQIQVAVDPDGRCTTEQAAVREPFVEQVASAEQEYERIAAGVAIFELQAFRIASSVVFLDTFYEIDHVEPLGGAIEGKLSNPTQVQSSRF